MTIRAWYMDSDEVGDQRLEHKLSPNEDVSQEILDGLGVLRWTGIAGAEDPMLAKIKSDRGYNYTDIVYVCPEKLPEYETKIKNFYREHIHYDEEIRYIMDGSGYFDVRDVDDRWIRINLEAGDMIILPEGIYHRFTCDATNYAQAMRLFVGEPVWTPYNRDEIDEKKNNSRLKYISSFLLNNKRRKTETVFDEMARLTKYSPNYGQTQMSGQVSLKANTYFDGKCVSHTVTQPDGTRKSVGVILPSTLRFDLSTPEIMEVTSGTAFVSINGAAEAPYSAGQLWAVEAGGYFVIRAVEPVHYVCHFG